MLNLRSEEAWRWRRRLDCTPFASETRKIIPDFNCEHRGSGGVVRRMGWHSAVSVRRSLQFSRFTWMALEGFSMM